MVLCIHRMICGLADAVDALEKQGGMNSCILICINIYTFLQWINIIIRNDILFSTYITTSAEGASLTGRGSCQKSMW